MNRNVESHFSELPAIDIQRTIFDRSRDHLTSFNTSELIPFFVDEVLPGDSFRVTTSKVVRLQTLLTPTFSNIYLDTYFFFVPNRLVWNHWKEFCGENSGSAWIPQVEYQIPSISSPEGGFATGTIADYMGIPVGVEWDNEAERRPSALPLRAYALICSEFFRDQNLTDPLNIPTGDSNQTGSNGDDYINDVANGGRPFRVAKYHDYFTSGSKAPQKGPAVSFGVDPTVSYSSNNIPVTTGDPRSYTSEDVLKPLHGIVIGAPTTDQIVHINGSSPHTMQMDSGRSESAAQNFYPTNLSAPVPDDFISVSGVGFNINELRLAFQLQKYYEKLSLAGSRYTEQLRYLWGVTAPDASLQRPEYLGGNRIPLNIHEVTNTAQGEQDFLGDLGAMSVTSDIHEDFAHSFTEHGYIIGVCCVRYDHSYPQGLERFWSRRKYTDFYQPVFANLGNQPVFQSEICATAENMVDSTVFAYQEAWADYRYAKNLISGEMRPGIQNTLSSWHLGDYYTEAPTLSDSWIREDPTNVDRVLAVTSQVSNQVFADIYVKNLCTRAMPVYSIPGLIDHH